MVRAPCCEKMGLKRGPWTTEEDQILVSYIQSFGHGNWRALPKQAGLMRCGKSCRLRWMNYLRPDIKRGNFSKEEEDTIINLHEMLGNRWSAIAAKLPGRTDNEIKNVWHTYLKKRLNPNTATQGTKRKKTAKTTSKGDKPVTLQSKESITVNPTILDNNCDTVLSPSLSFSELSSPLSSLTESSVLNEESYNDGIDVKDSMIEFPDISDSFWSEVMPLESYTAALPADVSMANEAHFPAVDDFSHEFKSSTGDDGMDFWLRVFMEAGDLGGLPEIL